MWMSVIKASLKGQRLERSLRQIPPTSELSPSFPATLESHPSSLSALMQHGILKQAVYIKRSAGGGHHAESVAQEEEGIREEQQHHSPNTHMHKRRHSCLFFLLFYHKHILTCRRWMHTCACEDKYTHTVSLSRTKYQNTRTNTRKT